MVYKVTVDHPSIGEGTELVIPGLGTFLNGSTNIVSNRAMRQYRTMHSHVETEIDSDGNATHTPVMAPHPVDLKIYGVRIEKADDSPDEHEESGATGEEAK
jgi:hypothetical protein